MPTALQQVLDRSQMILSALDRRDLEESSNLTESILFGFEPNDWIQSEKGPVSVVLYALAQVLSRHCLFRDAPFGPFRACQLERLDEILGVKYGSSHSAPPLGNCTLDAAARFTFYYGISALHRRRYEDAAQYFRDVLRDGERLQNEDLQANAHFFLSACHRKSGGAKRQLAVAHLSLAREALQRLGASANRLAVVDIRKSSEEFSQGKFGEITRIASYLINNFGTDYSTLGHAQSVLAKIARRRREYIAAKTLIETAISNFQRRDINHRALARAYANLAHTNLLLARRNSDSIEQSMLLSDAVDALDRADQIYAARHYDRDTRPEVERLRAEVEFQQREFFTASERAERSYQSAARMNDYVEMSSARIVQCMCAIAQSEKGTAGHRFILQDGRLVHKAHSFAMSAVEVASRIANGTHLRRQARPHIWLGRVMLLPPFFDIGEANVSRNRAMDLLPYPKDQSGYIGDELAVLEEEIFRARRDQRDRTDNPMVICQVRMRDFVDSSWRETIDRLMEEMITSLVYRAGMTDEEVKHYTGIRQDTLTKVKKRCIAGGQIPESAVAKRRGRKPNAKREK